MNRFILFAPDSFKGTLTAEEVCEILSAAILKHFPYASVVSIPMADGGEGMTNAYLKLLHGEKSSWPYAAPWVNLSFANMGFSQTGQQWQKWQTVLV